MVNGEWWMVNHYVSRFSFRKRKAQALPTRSVSFREEALPTSGKGVSSEGDKPTSADWLITVLPKRQFDCMQPSVARLVAGFGLEVINLVRSDGN